MAHFYRHLFNSLRARITLVMNDEAKPPFNIWIIATESYGDQNFEISCQLRSYSNVNEVQFFKCLSFMRLINGRYFVGFESKRIFEHLPTSVYVFARPTLTGFQPDNFHQLIVMMISTVVLFFFLFLCYFWDSCNCAEECFIFDRFSRPIISNWLITGLTFDKLAATSWFTNGIFE